MSAPPLYGIPHAWAAQRETDPARRERPAHPAPLAADGLHAPLLDLDAWLGHGLSIREIHAPRHQLGVHSADPRCVSHTHDTDYCSFQLPGHADYCTADGRNTFMHTWREALRDERYWRVGMTMADLPPAASKESSRAQASAATDQCTAT